MARRPTKTDEPTRPRPIDDQGYELDEHGLPLSGPARQRVLAERGIADPALADPAVADEPPADPAPPADPSNPET